MSTCQNAFKTSSNKRGTKKQKMIFRVWRFGDSSGQLCFIFGRKPLVNFLQFPSEKNQNGCSYRICRCFRWKGLVLKYDDDNRLLPKLSGLIRKSSILKWRDLEKTAASACQKPSSLLDVTSPQFLDVFTKPSVKVVHFLSHFSSYSRKMIVELYVI